MNKLAIFAMFLLVIPGLGFADVPKTVTVCSSGCNYMTIQAAIDFASTGDTITVASGTYVGDLVITTDDIEIIGADKTTTTIKGISNVLTTSWPLAGSEYRYSG